MRAAFSGGLLHSGVAASGQPARGWHALQIEVVKNYPLDGPVLFPLEEDLPPMARPFSAAEQAKGQRLAAKWGVAEIEPLAPMAVDVATDELAFYPFLYWPVLADAPYCSTRSISAMRLL